MKRQLRIAAFLCLVLPAVLPDEALAGPSHTGELLGAHAGERTVTLRVRTPDGKELMVFQVPEEAIIRREGSDRRLEFADLKPGMRVSVTGHRQEGRRVADEIVIRRDPEGS